MFSPALRGGGSFGVGAGFGFGDELDLGDEAAHGRGELGTLRLLGRDPAVLRQQFGPRETEIGKHHLKPRLRAPRADPGARGVEELIEHHEGAGDSQQDVTHFGPGKVRERFEVFSFENLAHHCRENRCERSEGEQDEREKPDAFGDLCLLTGLLRIPGDAILGMEDSRAKQAFESGLRGAILVRLRVGGKVFVGAAIRLSGCTLSLRAALSRCSLCLSTPQTSRHM